MVSVMDEICACMHVFAGCGKRIVCRRVYEGRDGHRSRSGHVWKLLTNFMWIITKVADGIGDALSATRFDTESQEAVEEVHDTATRPGVKLVMTCPNRPD